MEFVLFALFAICLSLVCLCVFILGLSYKERRELNNRLMATSVDEFIKMSSKPEEKTSDRRVSQHRKMVSEFKARGVNEV